MEIIARRSLVRKLGHVWTCMTMLMWCGKITTYLWRNDYYGLNKPFEKLSLFDFKNNYFICMNVSFVDDLWPDETLG